MASDNKTLVTSSVDTLIKIWDLSSNKEQVYDNVTTVQTKNGGITHGVQDATITIFLDIE